MFWLKGRKRKKLKARPFPQAWVRIIHRNVPYYGVLTDEEREELHGHIQVFLHEKRFEGCAGVEITEEIRLTVAAQACLLLLRRATNYFPTLRTILIYPYHYRAKTFRHIGGGAVVESYETRLGESWSRGEIVLSWDNVRHGAANMEDGLNVVLHEFAHQLDEEIGGTDGAPLLPDPVMYEDWARVLGREYEQLCEQIDRRRATFLNDYGATNPAEFFAVVTETFFEKPKPLKRIHPELYEQFKLFYQQDPAERLRRK